MTELTEQIGGLETEKTDLIAAIEKLRQGINELNREGRMRLLASFEEVNGHFKVLFQRLFGGGHQHGTVVGKDAMQVLRRHADQFGDLGHGRTSRLAFLQQIEGRPDRATVKTGPVGDDLMLAHVRLGAFA